MARIRLEGLQKVYPNGHAAVRDLDLRIEDGEFLVLVGPSGSGKSTVLRMIAGLEIPTGGTIAIGERDVTLLPPQERDLAMVFQSYALYPHMSVRENLAFGLKMRKVPRAEIDRRIDAVAPALGLEELLQRKPAQLSGGQRQRVALGRAIVREPQAFLFDEPLSNLDAKLRVETRAELARLHARLRATMVYVTHDQVEAMTLGDRVAVLRDGALQQVAPPAELYNAPANVFVAGFIGSPGMNLLEGEIDQGVFRSGPLVIPVGPMPPGRVWIGIRPHDLQLAGAGTPDAFQASAYLVELVGHEKIVHLEANGSRLVAVAPHTATVRTDEVVSVTVASGAHHLFDGPSGRRIEP